MTPRACDVILQFVCKSVCNSYCVLCGVCWFFFCVRLFSAMANLFLILSFDSCRRIEFSVTFSYCFRLAGLTASCVQPILMSCVYSSFLCIVAIDRCWQKSIKFIFSVLLPLLEQAPLFVYKQSNVFKLVISLSSFASAIYM